MTEDLWADALSRLEANGEIPVSISCTGAVFPFQIKMDKLTFLRGIALTGSSLEAGAQITSCNFLGGVHLDYVDFDDAVVFTRDSRMSALSGSYGHMDRDRQHVAFVDCQIEKDVRFAGFSGDLRLEGCRVGGSIDVSNGWFSHLALSGSILRGRFTAADADVRLFRAENTSFERTTAIGPLSAESIDLEGAIFGSRAQVLVSARNASLRSVQWQRGGRVEVEDAKVALDGAVLGSTLSLIGKGSAALQSIQDADAGLLSVSTIDLSRCIFRGSHRLQELSIDSTVTLPRAPRFRARRRCIADEFAWRRRKSG